jgi:hypothetical protein
MSCETVPVTPLMPALARRHGNETTDTAPVRRGQPAAAELDDGFKQEQVTDVLS